MRRLRVGIVGSGPVVDWAILPVLTGPDIISPPDEGAWWSRRPTAGSDIPWQPPATVQVVAMAPVIDLQVSASRRKASSKKLSKTPEKLTFPGIEEYSNAEDMLAQSRCDAVIVALPASRNQSDTLLASCASHGVKHLFCMQPPACRLSAFLLGEQAAARELTLVWSQRAAHAAAHRAALRLISRGEIGDVTALSLRVPTSFHDASKADDDFFEAVQAVDLLMACADTAPVEVLASGVKGSTTLWLRFASGAVATALFAAADSWNAPWPRLEISGTQGRSLVCEGGRKLWFYQPREATRLIEPPGVAMHLSAPNLGGVGEELKTFIALCTSREKKPYLSKGVLANHKEIVRALMVLEAAGDSLQCGAPVELDRQEISETLLESHRKDLQSEGDEASPPLTLQLTL